MTGRGEPTIAELLAAPPDGFQPVHSSRAAAEFAAPLGRDVGAFWASCPRADWMLFVAGWCAAEPRRIVKAGTVCVRRAEESLGVLEDEHRAILVELDAFAEGAKLGDMAIRAAYPPMGGPVDDLAKHFLAAALMQACALAAGPTVGRSYPLMCSQMALYPARALADGGAPDGAFLASAADDLRVWFPAPTDVSLRLRTLGRWDG